MSLCVCVCTIYVRTCMSVFSSLLTTPQHKHRKQETGAELYVEDGTTKGSSAFGVRVIADSPAYAQAAKSLLEQGKVGWPFHKAVTVYASAGAKPFGAVQFESTGGDAGKITGVYIGDWIGHVDLCTFLCIIYLHIHIRTHTHTHKMYRCDGRLGRGPSERGEECIEHGGGCHEGIIEKRRQECCNIKNVFMSVCVCVCVCFVIGLAGGRGKVVVREKLFG